MVNDDLGRIAQLVEHFIDIEKVSGSSPDAPTYCNFTAMKKNKRILVKDSNTGVSPFVARVWFPFLTGIFLIFSTALLQGNSSGFFIGLNIISNALQILITLLAILIYTILVSRHISKAHKRKQNINWPGLIFLALLSFLTAVILIFFGSYFLLLFLFIT